MCALTLYLKSVLHGLPRFFVCLFEVLGTEPRAETGSLSSGPFTVRNEPRQPKDISSPKKQSGSGNCSPVIYCVLSPGSSDAEGRKDPCLSNHIFVLENPSPNKSLLWSFYMFRSHPLPRLPGRSASQLPPGLTEIGQCHTHFQD